MRAVLYTVRVASPRRQVQTVVGGANDAPGRDSCQKSGGCSARGPFRWVCQCAEKPLPANAAAKPSLPVEAVDFLDFSPSMPVTNWLPFRQDPSGPIPKFAGTCGTFGCELRNRGPLATL